MDDMFEVVVAGGGLAGLTAALTAARAGRTVMTLTGGMVGGLLLSVEKIEGLPAVTEEVAGYDLCPATQELAEASGAAFSTSRLQELAQSDVGWTIQTDDGLLQAASVILATGASFRRLDVPGAERFVGHGVSTCAGCDGPLFRGRVAVVVGGGDSALQEALTLAEMLERVILLVRADVLQGQMSLRTRVLRHPSIDVRFCTVVEELLGDDAVSSVRIRDVLAGTTEDLEVAAVFPFIGLEANSDPVRRYVELDRDGRIVTDRALRTALPGVFAAGLVRSGAAGRAIATAGEGATAGTGVDSYLRTRDWPSPRAELHELKYSIGS
jgi:thioredoxin reductase (NADPH)